jgi:hypothetical protein
MYAYIPEIGCAFFDGVRALNDQACISSDLPPPCRSWIASCQSCLRLTRFLPLATANVYLLLHILCLAISSRAGNIGHPPLP